MSATVEGATKPITQVKNRILLALPSLDLQRLLAKLEFVNLARGAVLYDVGGVIRQQFVEIANRDLGQHRKRLCPDSRHAAAHMWLSDLSKE
jgi:hypothetical protein